MVVRWDPGPRLNPLVASVILFGPASVVLASAAPIAVRLSASTLERLGRTAGTLFALSTIGSIFGTFATSFWLVPELGTDQVIATGATTLVAAALVVAVTSRLQVAAVLLTASLVPAIAITVAAAPSGQGRLTGVAAQNWSPLVREREKRTPRRLDPATVASVGAGYLVREARETRYHRMVVADDQEARYLRFDSSFQSAMWLDEPFRTRFRYTDYLDLGLAYNPGAEDVLFIGLGGGSAPKRFWRDFPALQLQVVELDPDVVDAAYKWFALPRDPRLQVDTSDGRQWLRDHRERWDVIVIDAFYADAIPFQLTTHEFLELVRTRLEPGGVVVVNIIAALTGPDSKLLRSITRTYRSAFPTVLLHPVYDGPGIATPPTRATSSSSRPTAAAAATSFLRKRWEGFGQQSRGAPDLDNALRDRWERPVPFDDVPLLTDDYAPTDALLLE